MCSLELFSAVSIFFLVFCCLNLLGLEKKRFSVWRFSALISTVTRAAGRGWELSLRRETAVYLFSFLFPTIETHVVVDGQRTAVS